MRGNELLDHMELVDPAYIEEADSMPKKKRKNRWATMAACLAVMMLLGGIMIGAELTNPEATRPEDIPSAVIDWEMYAVWVDEHGNVHQGELPIEFSVQCTFYANGKNAGAPALDYTFRFPEDFRYLIEMPDTGTSTAWGPNMTGYPYYITSGYQYDFEKVDYTFGYWAVSLEKEWMIFEWEYFDGGKKNPGTYLIASRDPNADPQEILTYFQGFLDSYSPSGPHIVPPGIGDYSEENQGDNAAA